MTAAASRMQASDDPLYAPLLAGDRRALARAITLIESTREDHRLRADTLLSALLPRTGRSTRLGITGIPGVGKKTAERLVVELRDKVTKLTVETATESVPVATALPVSAISDDVVSALVNLGYQKTVAEKAVAKVFKVNPDVTFETALKLALGSLALQ